MIDTKTIAVYDKQVSEYAKMASEQSDDPALERFIERVKPRGYVLDLGCGPAIASSIMKNKGLRVDPVDASPEMVQLANQQFDIGARQGFFCDIKGENIYDGIWANFSLLHASITEFTDVLTNLYTALKPEGVFHLGMKTGAGSSRDRLGRFYSYYSQEQLCEHLHQAGFNVDNIETGEGAGLAGSVDPWIVIICQKPA